MNGLSTINIELTSRCNKSCHMCGRRKMERQHPELCNWGDMPFDMLVRIAEQIPQGVLVQLHWNGEPLLYPKLGAALNLLRRHYLCLDTNGKLLMARADEITPYLSSVTISVIPDDPEEDEQLDIAQRFIELSERPLVVFRMLGYIDNTRRELISSWTRLYPKVMAVKRILHSPEGSYGYEKRVTIPEHGICLEMLHKLAIDRHGDVYPCVRYDPYKKNLIANVEDFSLADIWNSEVCLNWIQHHINGRRDLVPLCGECDYWGVPRG